MYMRAVIYRIIYVAIVSVGILLSAALRQTTVQAAPVAAVRPVNATAVAPAPVVTLATIHVHASAGRARAVPRAAAHTVATADAAAEPAGGHAAQSAPTLRLDMPYYSFGKMLPRVGKGLNQ
jgi:hypothetical protein